MPVRVEEHSIQKILIVIVRLEIEVVPRLAPYTPIGTKTYPRIVTETQRNVLDLIKAVLWVLASQERPIFFKANHTVLSTKITEARASRFRALDLTTTAVLAHGLGTREKCKQQ